MNIFGMARHGLTDFEQLAVLFVIFTAIISLLYAWYLRNRVMKKDKGTADMQAVWNAIRIGADSYFKPADENHPSGSCGPYDSTFSERIRGAAQPGSV